MPPNLEPHFLWQIWKPGKGGGFRTHGYDVITIYEDSAYRCEGKIPGNESSWINVRCMSQVRAKMKWMKWMKTREDVSRERKACPPRTSSLSANGKSKGNEEEIG